jgi:transposase-like protein
MKAINQIAQEFGVHPFQVGQWKRESQAQAKSLFEGKRGPAPVSIESAPDRLVPIENQALPCCHVSDELLQLDRFVSVTLCKVSKHK